MFSLCLSQPSYKCLLFSFLIFLKYKIFLDLVFDNRLHKILSNIMYYFLLYARHFTHMHRCTHIHTHTHTQRKRESLQQAYEAGTAIILVKLNFWVRIAIASAWQSGFDFKQYRSAPRLLNLITVPCVDLIIPAVHFRICSISSFCLLLEACWYALLLNQQIIWILYHYNFRIIALYSYNQVSSYQGS
jgi:hypothetical protein